MFSDWDSSSSSSDSDHDGTPTIAPPVPHPRTVTLLPRAWPREVYRRALRQHEFRLLELKATSAEDVHISLREYKSFSACPAYEALSWAWGDTSPVAGLRVDNYDVEIGIPRDCLAMLKNLHRQTRSRYLWIDAICINQRDPIERAQQVSMMNHIYGTAGRVVAYTGEENAVSNRVLSQLNGTCPGELNNKSLRYFIDRSWFHRSWVIQEVLLAKRITLQAGVVTAPWSALDAALTKAVKAGFYSNASKRRDLVQLRRWYLVEGPQRTVNAKDMKRPLPSTGVLEYHQLYDLLDETWEYGASVPRDKLYSKLALFTGPCPEQLRPSYTASESEVFSSLSTFLQATCDCGDGRLLSLLSAAQSSTTTTSVLRSAWSSRIASGWSRLKKALEQ